MALNSRDSVCALSAVEHVIPKEYQMLLRSHPEIPPSLHCWSARIVFLSCGLYRRDTGFVISKTDDWDSVHIPTVVGFLKIVADLVLATISTAYTVSMIKSRVLGGWRRRPLGMSCSTTNNEYCYSTIHTCSKSVSGATARKLGPCKMESQ
jgi:hypothetical protein